MSTSVLYVCYKLVVFNIAVNCVDVLINKYLTIAMFVCA